LQLLVPVDAATKPLVYCLTRLQPIAGAQVAFTKHADGNGYDLEGSVPWKELSDIAPQPNTRIPFYMKVTYGNRDGSHYAFQLDWSGAPSPFNEPAGWNNALISGFQIAQ
ncbi:MAG: hypothetical protein HY646_05680, partial [Acidobacteria bacterium]|nr:hypothetical protein [Acidobacteriota bacterium]